ncbi:hypothetical protein RHGRI_015019 [Rhododendron griersonianum]|uniref:Protein kinase domain-containing protein n=1 Tax=Rhododendron griersonianum TaxID=479676 RepID=A0AAV6KC59_9ERIC|nr:hypothetical protein RHGRI_015019 [Rhododendron griersonianum]
MGNQLSNPKTHKTKHISNKYMKFSLPCSKFIRCFSPSDTLIPNRSLDGEGGDEDFRVFAYNELEAASQSFHPSNKIGEGGFGSVYKGRLRDGTFVAIKVLAVELESMRGEREFIAELAALSNIKHENLVMLRGCCVYGAERLLVYDHMENNSLSHAFLDEFTNVQLQAWEMYRANSLAVLVDPVLNGNFPAEEAVRFLKVGLLCVQEMPKKRPQMSEVLKMLTDETDTSNVEISQPGLMPDLMDVKIRSRRHS